LRFLEIDLVKMEIAKNYDPNLTEKKWYNEWMSKGLFHSEPDEREAYTIVIPPPNVTGVLHMGHILNNTIQDVLIRRARLNGMNACWVPGTDHASIATEAKVVRRLREKGITKADIGREKFLEHAWEWKEEFGGIILEQLKRLGASCDWDRTRFTMEPKLSSAVVKVFVDLFQKGYLYRDLKMVNWDPKAQTTLSNEEVIYKEEQSRLYYIRYRIEGSDEDLTIATTRPETILGDTAICVHPEDERYAHLKGKKALVPLIGRPIPVIFDTYVDREFGTGALKITPAHDPNDYELGAKHGLETVNILNADASMSEEAQLYIGEDRFEVRKKIALELEEKGHLVKVEELQNKVGYSERNPDTVIEPRLSLQWFVDMQKLSGPALEHVMNDDIDFHPSKYKNVYKHWMENIRDWPISRQLWWGQRIPAYYYGEDGVAVAETPEEALAIAREQSGHPDLSMSDLCQDEDVVDTWFSSWLWPITVFDGFENKEELDYYYPTNVLVTGWDIIFFWVARMIMAGYEYKEEKPFKSVYFTGMVRDKQRRKMSKSLGNSPDPMDLFDQYGADGVRVGMLLSAPAGNDLLFDEKLCEQGRNFSNKIWNGFRLIKSWKVSEDAERMQGITPHQVFAARLRHVMDELETQFEQYRISDALMSTYKLVWDDFSSWYLEMMKPAFGEAMHPEDLELVSQNLESVLSLLHPFMPFITEEVWQQLREREEGEYLMISAYPEKPKKNEELSKAFSAFKETVSGVRNYRKSKNIPNKELLQLKVLPNEAYNEGLEPLLMKMAGLSEIESVSEKQSGSFSFTVGTNLFFIPMEGNVDIDAEINKLEEELKYQQGFLNAVMKKLGNERFVNNAPEQVVAVEKKKRDDAETRIQHLKEQLESLQN
jgi:valyl-tRNA synthetase